MAHDNLVVNQQIAQKVIKVFIFNRWNATPDVKRLVDAARARGIPGDDGHRETLVPAGAMLQAWQVGELRGVREFPGPCWNVIVVDGAADI